MSQRTRVYYVEPLRTTEEIKIIEELIERHKVKKNPLEITGSSNNPVGRE